MAFRSKHNVVLTDPPSRLNLPSMSSTVANPSLFSYASPTPYSPTSQSSSAAAIPRRKLLRSKQPGCINSCLDAMRGSSPPRIKPAKEFSLESAGQDMVDAAYRSWMLKHPSALTMFEEMMNASVGKQIVVFLDYDGTLSPIVDDPDRAYMSDKMRSAVREVARYFPTAIISGRCRDKVYDFVQLAELYYAGSHGMDIMGPSKNSRGSKDSDILLYQPASAFLPMIDKVFATLVEKTKRISGACVENNRFCLSVHFRRVEEKSWSTLAEQVKSVVKEYPELRLTQGRKVLEIRPVIKWDKGKALEFLLESLGLADCNNVVPLYIGDDRTDEDAFKVLRNRGQGYGILVSTVPKETNASYSLKEPSEVRVFLRRLVKFSHRSKV